MQIQFSKMFENAILTPPPPDFVVSWIGEVFGAAEIAPIAGDASARRYFRARRRGQSCIVMHSPPSEKPAQFLAIREFLESRGIRAPRLLSADAARGLIAMEDFGDRDYLSVLSQNDERRSRENLSPEILITAALRALVAMQTSPPPPDLPEYDEALLVGEIFLFPQWHRARHLQKPLSAAETKVFDRAAAFLAREWRNQSRVFVHRDYHSRNLMHIGESSPGILDFQDAVAGPAGYDLVSLLRDAYIFWNPIRRKQWREEYRRLAKESGAPIQSDARELEREINIVGAQRGLKVVGIFARLHYRDGKSNYLRDIPRAFRHLLFACDALPELKELAMLLRAAPPQ